VPAAAQQAYPSKPVRIISPFPPGGGNDMLCRIVAQKLTEEFKQQVIVENRAGANGIIGTEIAARSAPGKDRANQPRHGEDVLPVRHRRKHVLLDPLAVEEHALLVAARAEGARLAGESKQKIVPAGIAVDACEAVMEIAALQEPLDRALCHRSAESTRLAKLLAVALRATPHGARAPVARAVDPATRRFPRVPCAALAAS
jgi:hypothetical protein